MQLYNRASTFTITFAITIIQLFISLITNLINVFINIHFFRLKTELVIYDYYNFQRFISRVYNYEIIVNRVYNREVIVILIALISEQRVNNSIYVDLKVFIDKMKKDVTLHNRKALKNAKMKLLNKYYKFYHIQK